MQTLNVSYSRLPADVHHLQELMERWCAQVETPDIQLGPLAFKQPLKWLPVLCALLKQSNGGLAPEVLCGWQQSLHQALCDPPVQLLVSKTDHGLFWLLTCSSQLSSAFASLKLHHESAPEADAWQVSLQRGRRQHASRGATGILFADEMK